MKLSPKAQKLWDDFGEAFDNHVDASNSIYEPRNASPEERTMAASAYITASKKLYNYIATLERKVAKSNEK